MRRNTVFEHRNAARGHAAYRARQRLGLDIDAEGVEAVEESLRANWREWIGHKRQAGRSLRLYEVTVDGVRAFPVYDETLRAVVTFLADPVQWYGRLHGESEAAAKARAQARRELQAA